MKTMTDRWDDVHTALDDSLAITWDGCHKIYLLLDMEQVTEFESYGYEPYGVDDTDEAFDIVKGWFAQSCFLRFVQAVATNHDDPNAGYRNLIPQGAEADDYEEDDE